MTVVLVVSEFLRYHVKHHVSEAVGARFGNELEFEIGCTEGVRRLSKLLVEGTFLFNFDLFLFLSLVALVIGVLVVHILVACFAPVNLTAAQFIFGAVVI